MGRLVISSRLARHKSALMIGGAVLCGAVLFAWSAATTSYILFHDDALRLINDRASGQAAEAEQRISELEAELTEERTRKAVEQKRMEALVEQIRQRQIAIEARHGLLSDLLGTGGSGRGAANGAMPAPSPISDTVILAPADMREARMDLRSAQPTVAKAPSPDTNAAATKLAGVIGELDRVEREQMDLLNGAEERIERRSRRVRSVLADLGLKVPLRPSGAPALAATGGPFVPVSAMDDAFAGQGSRARQMAADLKWLEERIDVVPLRRPVSGAVDTTSGFGVRLDPFLGRAAFHTGIDFRGNTGDPARATAAGKVTSAGREGGYGLMVEVDHGNGLSTRYAHLSSIAVSVGEPVARGQIVGRIGSTGRSTGPHLHYETRINGEAVDPQRFLRAGLRLAEGS